MKKGVQSCSVVSSCNMEGLDWKEGGHLHREANKPRKTLMITLWLVACLVILALVLFSFLIACFLLHHKQVSRQSLRRYDYLFKAFLLCSTTEKTPRMVGVRSIGISNRTVPALRFIILNNNKNSNSSQKKKTLSSMRS